MVEITSTELLRALYLMGKESEVMYVSYRSGERAMRSTIGDVAVLARHGHVYGVVKRGKLASVRLMGSIHAAHRQLADCRAGSEARQGSITTKRKSGLRYSTEYMDVRRAKLGRLGGFSQWRKNSYERVEAKVPGIRSGDPAVVIERREVA